MAFTIVTIEGEGEDSEYTRLADDLVRRSSLFNSFTFKLWRSEQNAGRQREIRIRWKARFNEVRAEFKEYEKQVNKILKHQQKKVAEARADRDSWKKKLVSANQRHNVVVKNLRKLIALKKPLEKYRDLVMKNQRFFETEFTFRKGSHIDYIRAEMMLRIMFVYEKEKATGGITASEYMFLALGTQLPAFRKEDFERRFPDFTKHFARDLGVLIDKGYIKQFYRKQQWYLTLQGKERFEAIIGQLYNKQIGYYWKGLLEKL